jgi:hypothetical protein
MVVAFRREGDKCRRVGILCDRDVPGRKALNGPDVSVVENGSKRFHPGR